MRVVAFNGSPKAEGNTYHAIRMVADELEKQGVEVEIVHVGNQQIRGCLACGACARNKDQKCVIQGDDVNVWIKKMNAADGIIIGSPVYYSGIAGTMKCFLDRAFYAGGSALRHKVGAAVVAVRRSGGVTTFDQLNHYLMYAEMLLPTSNYWNVIHGAKPGEVSEDEEGRQIMSVLGNNMAWLLKMSAQAKTQEGEPEAVRKVFTNFVR